MATSKITLMEHRLVSSLAFSTPVANEKTNKHSWKK